MLYINGRDRQSSPIHSPMVRSVSYDGVSSCGGLHWVRTVPLPRDKPLLCWGGLLGSMLAKLLKHVHVDPCCRIWSGKGEWISVALAPPNPSLSLDPICSPLSHPTPISPTFCPSSTLLHLSLLPCRLTCSGKQHWHRWEGQWHSVSVPFTSGMDCFMAHQHRRHSAWIRLVW